MPYTYIDVLTCTCAHKQSESEDDLCEHLRTQVLCPLLIAVLRQRDDGSLDQGDEDGPATALPMTMHASSSFLETNYPDSLVRCPSPSPSPSRGVGSSDVKKVLFLPGVHVPSAMVVDWFLHYRVWYLPDAKASTSPLSNCPVGVDCGVVEVLGIKFQRLNGIEYVTPKDRLTMLACPRLSNHLSTLFAESQGLQGTVRCGASNRAVGGGGSVAARESTVHVAGRHHASRGSQEHPCHD